MRDGRAPRLRVPTRWELGDACEKHELTFCAVCKPSTMPRQVVVSSGGAVYHRSTRCCWLIIGQDATEAAGRNTGALSTKSRYEAERIGRTECGHCFGRCCSKCGARLS